jgi:hypothetical protein
VTILPDSSQDAPLSDGEVDFLWWFIQGSLMDAGVRARLYAHWGLCPRHALAFFIVESSFRPHLIHGCTILYAELMKRALKYLSTDGIHGLVPDRLTLHFLRVSGPCHLCDLGYGPQSAGNAPAERLEQGRDASCAIRFATENSNGWLPYVCGVCAGTDSVALCRPHLVAAMEREGVRCAASQAERVKVIASHMNRLDNSFRWEQRGTDTSEDRGALLAAMGWCNGWSSLLQGLLYRLPSRTNEDPTPHGDNKPHDPESIERSGEANGH